MDTTLAAPTVKRAFFICKAFFWLKILPELGLSVKISPETFPSTVRVQKGFGTWLCLSMWRSTQKFSVGVWQGP